MHRIDDTVVVSGGITLSELPFRDGEHVRVLIDRNETPSVRRTIDEVNALLAGNGDFFADPSEPVIPIAEWDALK